MTRKTWETATFCEWWAKQVDPETGLPRGKQCPIPFAEIGANLLGDECANPKSIRTLINRLNQAFLDHDVPVQYDLDPSGEAVIFTRIDGR